MQLLREQDTYPTDEVLEEVLGLTYPLFRRFIQLLIGSDDIVALGWRYYKDGGAWLGKLTHQGKTLLWLSIWEGYFKVSIFFTERTRGGVMELGIDQQIKAAFSKSEVAGKLVSLITDVKEERQLGDLLMYYRV